MASPIKKLAEEANSTNDLIPFPDRFAESVSDLSSETASMRDWNPSQQFVSASGIVLSLRKDAGGQAGNK